MNWCARDLVAASMAGVLVSGMVSKACIIPNPKFALEIDTEMSMYAGAYAARSLHESYPLRPAEGAAVSIILALSFSPLLDIFLSARGHR